MSDDKLNYMKKNIIQSFKWQKDVVIPTAQEFGISPEEISEFYMDNLSTGALEALYGCFDTAKELDLAHRFHADLRLTFYCDTLNFIDEDDVFNIKSELATKVMNGKHYDDVLKEGRKKLFALMKKNLE